MVASKQRKLLRELFCYAFGADELPTDTTSTTTGNSKNQSDLK